MKLIILFALVALATANEIEQYQKQLRDGSVQFTNKMFYEVVKSNPSKSVVLSAYSVLTPLAQMSLGATGESHDELLNAMGLQNDNVTRAVFPVAKKELENIKGVDLKFASKLYIPVNLELNEQFEADNKLTFPNSEVQNVDFSKSKETAGEINEWVEQRTNNRIKDLVSPDSLDANTRILLVNAIYFKGAWKNKFDATLTEDRDFHSSVDKTTKVPTMHKKDDFKYAESKELNAKLLEISYEGDEASMLFVLPNEIDGLAPLEEKIKENPILLMEATKQMHKVEVDVYLPKFKIETTTDLKDILPKIGVSKIFDAGSAKLDHMLKTQEPLYVSKAIQKAFIEVNEEGAEAAAANAFGIAFASAIVQFETFEFKADKPFYFELRTKGETLFNGAYYE